MTLPEIKIGDMLELSDKCSCYMATKRCAKKENLGHWESFGGWWLVMGANGNLLELFCQERNLWTWANPLGCILTHVPGEDKDG